MAFDDQDRNPFLWRCRGSGARWWRYLVNGRASDGTGNLFAQPALAGDDVDLMPSLQPVLTIEPDDLQRNPLVPGIAISSIVGYLSPGVNKGATFTAPVFDPDVIDRFVRSQFGASVVGLHPTALLLSYGGQMYPNVGNAPDFDDPINNPSNTPLFDVSDCQFQIGGRTLSYVSDPTNRRANLTYMRNPDALTNVEVLLGGIPTHHVVLPSNTGQKRTWAVMYSDIIVYPVAGKPLRRAVGVPSLNTFRDITPS